METKGKVNYPNTGVKIVNVADLDDAARSTINLPNDVNKGIVVADIKKDSLGDKSGLQKNLYSPQRYFNLMLISLTLPSLYIFAGNVFKSSLCAKMICLYLRLSSTSLPSNSTMTLI